MVTRTAQGTFWLSGRPENSKRGHVIFNDAGGLTLLTEGGFDDSYGDPGEWEPFFVLPESQEPVNICGLLTSDHVKMVGCVVESASGGEIGRFGTVPHTFRWKCGLGFVGAKYDGDIPKRIKSATVRISGLNTWVSGFDGVGVVVDSKEGKITWSLVPEVRSAEWSLGKITINHQARYTIDLAGHHVNETRVTSDTSIGVELSETQPWDVITDVVESLQCLVSISAGQSANVESVSVMVESDGNRENLAAYYTPNLYCGTAPLKFPPLLSFDDIGQVEGVAHWIDVLRDRRVTRRALVSDMFVQPIFITDRTGHLISACEAFMRDTGASRTANLNLSREILQPLIDRAGPGFQADVGDVGQWKSKVSQIRNHYGIGHLQDNPNAPTLEDLLVVNRQLSVLVTVCLLRECGAPETVIMKVVQRSQATWWVAL